MEEVKAILQLIATYGLPIVLTCWFVFRLDGILTRLVTTLSEFIAWLRMREEERCKREAEVKVELKEIAAAFKERADATAREVRQELKEASESLHDQLEEREERIERTTSEAVEKLATKVTENNTLISVLGAKLSQ